MANKYERAAQIMPVLRLVAKHQSRIAYNEMATAIGGPAIGIGQWLGPVQDYCEVQNLPPLTVLVVNEETGEPGPGYRVRDTVGRDREAVYAYDWLLWSGGEGRVAPTPEEFEKAEQLYATLQVEHLTAGGD